MRKIITITLAAAALAGCQMGAERREAQDDEYCRRAITERNDARPTAYQECRQNMMAYHDQDTALRMRRQHIFINQ